MATLPAEIESPLVREVKRQLLMYAAGQLMFCPQCDDILDWKKTVTVYAQNQTHVCTMCGPCWDAMLPKIPAKAIAVAEITDGRRLK